MIGVTHISFVPLATGFGTTGNAFGTSTPAAGGGLFGGGASGSTAPAGGGLFGGQSTTTGFGGFGTQPQTGGGGFCKLIQLTCI